MRLFITYLVRKPIHGAGGAFMKQVYKRVDNSPPKLLETLTVEARLRGHKTKMVTIEVYDTLQDSYQLNDCVGLPQNYQGTRIHHTLRQNRQRYAYAISKGEMMEYILVILLTYSNKCGVQYKTESIATFKTEALDSKGKDWKPCTCVLARLT